MPPEFSLSLTKEELHALREALLNYEGPMSVMTNSDLTLYQKVNNLIREIEADESFMRLKRMETDEKNQAELGGEMFSDGAF